MIAGYCSVFIDLKWLHGNTLVGHMKPLALLAVFL
jgi:hypothetical protein